MIVTAPELLAREAEVKTIESSLPELVTAINLHLCFSDSKAPFSSQ